MPVFFDRLDGINKDKSASTKISIIKFNFLLNMNSSTAEIVYDIFQQICKIPRPSHYEGAIADFLCRFAESLGLEYDRDGNDCVVIRKDATPGFEKAETVVLLNHMDMVAVSDGSRPFNPLADGIETFVCDGWMHAKGTSLGADNGIGLSMALAVLADSTIQHGPIEVLTTTNEEDGMTGAAALSADFIRGRKVINLDSEDYDTITIGAAGAYIQKATLPIKRIPTPEGLAFFRVCVSGGQGGHSGVDINKMRCNAIKTLCNALFTYKYIPHSDKESERILFSSINGGEANASIPSRCEAIVGVDESCESEFVTQMQRRAAMIERLYSMSDPDVSLTIEKVAAPDAVFEDNDIPAIIDSIPCGPLSMRDDMPDTVMTSNNIGVIASQDDVVAISCHTRSFDNSEMTNLAEGIASHFMSFGATTETLMNTPGWQENAESSYLELVDNTFCDILGFHPRKVAMHFVLEAGYYVEKYPGIEIACIGPRIIEPHSARERVELNTVDGIWEVLVELLKRLSIV